MNPARSERRLRKEEEEEEEALESAAAPPNKTEGGKRDCGCVRAACVRKKGGTGKEKRRFKP